MRHPSSERAVGNKRVVTSQKMRPSAAFQRQDRISPPLCPGTLQCRRQPFEPAARHLGNQRVAVTEMAVGGRRANTDGAGDLRHRQSGEAPVLDHVERRLHQRLPQVAVVVAARIVLGHVGRSYITSGPLEMRAA